MKIAFYILVVVIAIASINFWYEIYIVGRCHISAGLFLTILGALFPFAAIYSVYLLITKIKNR